MLHPTLKYGLLTCLLGFAAQGSALAQNSITEIITNYNGYWKSGVGSINSVKPDNNHELLSFTFNGTRYSTGVKDSLLQAHGDAFIPGDYRALPVSAVGTVNSNTKIGLGAMFDGVYNGASNPAPANDIQYYLTDGVSGLDIGTCVANLPAGTLYFASSNVKPEAVGDGVPDIVVTQVAEPSSSAFDRYEFVDINGSRIGSSVDIRLNNIQAVGNWVADFYEASVNPMVLQSGFTQTERKLRLWTADFSDFGLNSSNIGQVAYFKITLSGSSDVAFVAYNYNAMAVLGAPLAVSLKSFNGQWAEDANLLQWQLQGDGTVDHFVVERSTDALSFTSAGIVPVVAGQSAYTFKDNTLVADGVCYYRLKMIDASGKFVYSRVIEIRADKAPLEVQVYPNPATNLVYVEHRAALTGDCLLLYNRQGHLLRKIIPDTNSTSTSISVSHFPPGIYDLVWRSGSTVQHLSVVVGK